jgi:hypothetical protein
VRTHREHVTWTDWVLTAVVVVAFWALPIAATLALFPNEPLGRGHGRDDEP